MQTRQYTTEDYYRFRDKYDQQGVDWRDLMRDEECTCDKCAHWSFSRDIEKYAKVNGSTVQVGQCMMAGMDDAAPYAEVLGPEAAVFTQAGSRCGAFELHPAEVALLMEEFA